MKIGWFSCGVTSAVACKLAIEKYGNDTKLFYIHIDSAHPDNIRFIRDCEAWYGVKIEIIKSKKYKDQFDVIEKTKYINGAHGARCTLELKKKVRYELENTVSFSNQIFGFEFSPKEVNRAVRFAEQNPDTKPLYPLIEKQLSKQSCLKMLTEAGIELPQLYKDGFQNNNCIACVKGGMGYFNLIRKIYPAEFHRMAKLEREVGRSCIRSNKKQVFLDELSPNRGRHEPLVLPDCGTFCEIEFEDLVSKHTEEILAGKNIYEQLNLF